MTYFDPFLPRRASVEVLRAEATDELKALQLERLRAGEDPWDFMEELPTVDELVIYTLRAEYIVAGDGLRPTHERNRELLYLIGAEYPELERAIDNMLRAKNPYRLWDTIFREN